MVNITGSGDASYWDNYSERVQGAPYFLGFNTEFSDVPEFMPLDTELYTVWVPELADSGRIYTPTESRNIPNISPIKTEKIHANIFLELFLPFYCVNQVILLIFYMMKDIGHRASLLTLELLHTIPMLLWMLLKPLISLQLKCI